MAHFAELDENNAVLRVLVINDLDTKNSETGHEDESVGITFCKNTWGGKWIQASYTGKIRKRYPGIGYTYNPELDAFIGPKSWESWVLNTETCDWESPVGPAPELSNEDILSGKNYYWDEENLTWVFEQLTGIIDT